MRQRSAISAVALCLLCIFTHPAEADRLIWRVQDSPRNWQVIEDASQTVAANVSAETVQLRSFAPATNIACPAPPNCDLDWSKKRPFEFSERPNGHIWNLLSTGLSDDTIIVDGDSLTSTENRFKTFGASQDKNRFFLDLGSRHPINKITFFPRLPPVDIPAWETDYIAANPNEFPDYDPEVGLTPVLEDSLDKARYWVDARGDPLSDDYIRSYRLYTTTEVGEDNQPDWGNPIIDVPFSTDSVSVAEFDLDFVRFIRLDVTAPNPFELAEMELYGEGFVPTGEFVSEVIDLSEELSSLPGSPETANFGRLNFEVTRLRVVDGVPVEEPEAAGNVQIEMRSGSDDSPFVYFLIEDLFLGTFRIVSETEYFDNPADQGPIEDDQTNWSRWSPPFTESGQLVNLPSPRQFVQFRVSLESGSILDGMRINDIELELSSPPMAQSIFGEISSAGDPSPDIGFPEVPAGEFAAFQYDVIVNASSDDNGFDAIKILTPATPRFTQLLMGPDEDNLTEVAPIDTLEAQDGLTLLFPPEDRVNDETSIRVLFESQVLLQATVFKGEVFDSTNEEDLPQPILAGNANSLVNTDNLQVLTSAETGRSVLPFLTVEPRVITPNGDNTNDVARLNYNILQLLKPVPHAVEVFDLSGRRVFGRNDERGTGIYSGDNAETWDGTDSSGQLVPPGIYVVKVSVDVKGKSFVQNQTIGVVY